MQHKSNKRGTWQCSSLGLCAVAMAGLVSQEALAAAMVDTLVVKYRDDALAQGYRHDLQR